MSHAESRVPWFLWPFYAVWRLVTLILSVIGRLACALLGVALMVVGTVVTLTIVGAPPAEADDGKRYGRQELELVAILDPAGENPS